MPVSNPTETIDSRILRLIGLEDVFDLDYETYLLLLKEAMVKGRMTKTTIPTEEIELLTNEYKRVKSKKDAGRFQVKTKKITAKSFTIGGKKLPGSKETKALPGTGIGISPVSKSLEDNIATITSSVVSIADIMRQQAKVASDSAAYDRRQAENEKRAVAESNLEKRFEGLKKAAEKIIAPVKGVLSKIFDFLTKIFFGRILYKLVEWFGDPKNASKVKSIIRFIGDWWPALLSSYILFGTSFGKFVRGTVGLIGRFIFQIGRVAIPQLLKLIRTPFGAGAALFSAGALIPAMFPDTVNKQESKTQNAPGTTEDKIRKLQEQKANLNLLQKMQGVGSEIDEQISSLKSGQTKSYGFSGGGYSGYISGQKGIDKIPAMLSDGEFVMSRGAVQMYGTDTLSAMNAAGGGTNRPRIISGLTYAQGGGYVGEEKKERIKDPLLEGRKFLSVGSNTPFVKDPISAIGRFIKFKFGADVNQRSTWGIPTPTSGTRTSGRTSTGSLMNDPIGAIQRIVNSVTEKSPDTSSRPSAGGNQFTRVTSEIQRRLGGLKGKPGEKNMFQEIGEKLRGPGAATYRDAGSIYAKQMLGGMGGPISERDLSGESQQELQKAIQRAKKRTSQQIRIEQQKLNTLLQNPPKPGQDKTKWNNAVATQRSFLKKFKEGGIRVQYTDYAENGKMSKSAENAKNILGQFWAYGRDKKMGGGYRVEDKYDFDKMKDPMGVLFGKGKTTQQRLQALHQMNPLKGGGDVDMVLGGKRTAAESWGLSASKTLLGGLFGASGKPKAQIASQKPKTKPVKPPSKSGPMVIYGKNDPRRKQKGPYKSRFARSGSAVPKFSASTSGSRTKTQTLGLMR